MANKFINCKFGVDPPKPQRKIRAIKILGFTFFIETGRK